MLPERDRLYDICQKALKSRELDSTYQNRLDDEMKEIDAQEEHEYLLGLYDSKVRFASNEHNLLIVYLLGLADNFDINHEPIYVQGEFPDIDTDFLPEVRDYLKNEWAPKKFGSEHVCSIGTYGTLGIKMALKDVTRVYGIPRHDIDLICKDIPDKDDDGKPLQWDKAQELCPGLKKYCEAYPKIAEAVQMFLNRRKSGGVHPGGLIISNKPIADFVPLEVRSAKKDQPYGVTVSSWGEGLHSQDLGAVGLIKFDLLVVDGLKQLAIATQLIKERYGIAHLWAKPGQRNWSDTSYLNDPQGLALANKGDTKCIFQFGSEGIRSMVKKGGVTSFKDIAAYSALYRPGPMNCLPKGTNVKIDSGYKEIESLDNTKDSIKYLSGNGELKSTKNYILHYTGKKKVCKITTKSGKTIITSLDHRYLKEDNNYTEAKDLKPGYKIAILK